MILKERLQATLNQKQSGKMVVDFQSNTVKGIHSKIVVGFRDFYRLENKPIRKPVKIIQVISILFILLSIKSVFAQNPICPAGVYIADPTARVFSDGQLYIYGSLDESPKYYCSHKYNMLVTSNLKDWNMIANIFSTTGKTDNVGYSDDILYAPDCIERDKKYYLYYCLASGGENEGVAVADSPTGPFGEGKKIRGISQIDPAVFIDDDGQAYYYWGQFAAKGAKMKPNMMELEMSTIKDSLVTESKHKFHEGSWMAKHNGKYYLVYTQISPRGEATAIGYSVSDSPLGPFKYGGIIIDNFGCDPHSWNNHGSIAEYKGQWYVFYHRSTHGCNTMRKACVEPIEFLPDGSIPQVEMTTQGASGPLNPFKTINAARACLMTGKTRIVQSGEHSEELARIENQNTATYKYFNFDKIPAKFKIRVCSQAGGTITVLTNNMCLPINATVNIERGDGKTYKDYTVDVSNVKKGIHPIYLKFAGADDTDLFKIDSFCFE